MKSKLEYIWLDGYEPTQSLRSKTLVKSDFGALWKIALNGHSTAVPLSRRQAKTLTVSLSPTLSTPTQIGQMPTWS